MRQPTKVPTKKVAQVQKALATDKTVKNRQLRAAGKSQPNVFETSGKMKRNRGKVYDEFYSHLPKTAAAKKTDAEKARARKK